MRRTRTAGEYRVEALARGMKVLDAFTGSNPRLGVSDVAKLVDLPIPTVFRLISTLQEAGYLEQLPDGKFRPSVRLLALGQASLRGSNLVEMSSGLLLSLSERTGQSVNLGVLNGDQILYLVRHRSRDLVSANLQVGSTLPAVYSSLGKLLLAFLPDEEFLARMARWSFARPMGPNSVRSITELRKQLAHIRKTDLAIQDEEIASGLRAFAKPVRNEEGRVIAAINLSCLVTEYSVEAMLKQFEPELDEVAAELSSRMGHR